MGVHLTPLDVRGLKLSLVIALPYNREGGGVLSPPDSLEFSARIEIRHVISYQF